MSSRAALVKYLVLGIVGVGIVSFIFYRYPVRCGGEKRPTIKTSKKTSGAIEKQPLKEEADCIRDNKENISPFVESRLADDSEKEKEFKSKEKEFNVEYAIVLDVLVPQEQATPLKATDYILNQLKFNEDQAKFSKHIFEDTTEETNETLHCSKMEENSSNMRFRVPDIAEPAIVELDRKDPAISHSFESNDESDTISLSFESCSDENLEGAGAISDEADSESEPEYILVDFSSDSEEEESNTENKNENSYSYVQDKKVSSIEDKSSAVGAQSENEVIKS
ncbi:hypothetical protein NEMIN01_0653 [Nematocida minor]|uniref:uncharacterized protein n=1 Tax=Nematocida minor TaxID=1912983 RepID=UPI002220BB11|nr:uncharacterized protein NEMIN01_0653 [Nematocida minor]KAI5189700.1 hypothetical protein NEMIN01_0653 [Nematocida minor]